MLINFLLMAIYNDRLGKWLYFFAFFSSQSLVLSSMVIKFLAAFSLNSICIPMLLWGVLETFNPMIENVCRQDCPHVMGVMLTSRRGPDWLGEVYSVAIAILTCTYIFLCKT